MPNSQSSTPAPKVLDTSDYVSLVRFLVEPFLDHPDALKVDCELLSRTGRVLIRLAFEGEDKGRVFGRGGRNIQAIRTVIQASAQMSGHTAHIDIYDSSNSGSEGAPERRSSGSRPPSRPPRNRPRNRASS
jgi:predicted RNA-binding protein YlqC (UPF0109 family)